MEGFNTAFNILLLIILVIWGWDQIKLVRNRRQDAQMRKFAAKHVGVIYVVEDISFNGKQDNADRYDVASVGLRSVERERPLLLNLYLGHTDYTDHIRALKGARVMLNYAENPAMTTPHKNQRPQAYLSYWLRMVPVPG